MNSSNLEKRMKKYEAVSKTKLMRRTPVIIRIDGKAFHTFTKGFQKPFDSILIKTMQETTKYLCENIQGCVLGYTQSDEITLVLVDYQKFETEAWFEYEIQKICSISASMATMAFNKFFTKNATDWILGAGIDCTEIKDAYDLALERGAMFDSRAFNIPKEEVTNCIYWRQLDASRNSVQMVGQANFSHKELENKSCSNIQNMLIEKKGVNWNDFPEHQKRGTCVVKENYIDAKPNSIDSKSIRTHWVIDKNIPIFKGEGREYIERLINFY